MKFFIQKEKLLYALQTVQKAVSIKNPLLALTGIYFNCQNGVLTVAGSDFDLSIRYIIPIEVEEEGSIILPARYILELARRLPNTLISLEANLQNNQVCIKYGDSQFNISGYNATDFLLFQIPDPIFSFMIDAEKLKSSFKQILFALSMDNNRPVFTGVFWEIKDNNLTVVATDTYRMAINKTFVDLEDSMGIIIPGKAIHELIRNSDFKGDIKVIVGRTHVTFMGENTTFIVKLISGKFPSYQQVIPKDFSTDVQIEVKDFLSSAERVALLAGENNSTVNLLVDENKLVLTIKSETAWIREELDAKIDGLKVEIAYNIKYLCDVLRAIQEDILTLKITGPFTPSLFKAEGNEEFVSILVPVKINND